MNMRVWRAPVADLLRPLEAQDYQLLRRGHNFLSFEHPASQFLSCIWFVCVCVVDPLQGSIEDGQHARKPPPVFEFTDDCGGGCA